VDYYSIQDNNWQKLNAIKEREMRKMVVQIHSAFFDHGRRKDDVTETGTKFI
jgi:hypothetical protein